MPMDLALYPPNWPEIALALKVAADWTCKRCGAKRGEKRCNRHGIEKPVVITVAHLNHDPWNRDAELEVMCRQCHITYDAKDGRRKRVMMAMARGQMVLPGLQGFYKQPRLRKQRPVSRRPRVARANQRQRTRKKVKT